MASEASDKRAIRTMIVEDQGLFRGFLERWLATVPGFTLVASAATGEEALLHVESSRPDVVLVDYQLPGMDGLEFIRSARQIRPQLRALVISSLVNPLALTRILEARVEGYLENDSSPDLLTVAMLAVAAGETYFSEKFHEIMSKERSDAESIGKILSRREQQVMALVIKGKTSREIGLLMGLSARTIEFHRANLMTKLGAKNLAELATIAQLRS